MEDLFATVVYPAKIVCQDCEEAGSPGHNATILNADQGGRWLRGHGTTFHNGPFQVGIWSGVTPPTVDLDFARQAIRDVWL